MPSWRAAALREKPSSVTSLIAVLVFAFFSTSLLDEHDADNAAA
jgi:hypothetical protein